MATTSSFQPPQESINAGLVQYFQNTNGKQPITYLFYLADKDGNPATQILLADLLKQTGNVNPFDIPDGTDYRDARVQKLAEVRFICGIKLEMGIPPGCVVNTPNKTPQLQLPQPIVTLGTTSESVLFNMYCSSVTVIENSPPTGFATQGSRKWFSQQPWRPWYVQTRTNLMTTDLIKDLKTPYFDNNPEERDALLARLNNISGSASSLQQLIFNLDGAVAQTTPKFDGVDDSAAEYMLGMSFVKLWATVAKERGSPLIGT